jgi:hypothetical protein
MTAAIVALAASLGSLTGNPDAVVAQPTQINVEIDYMVGGGHSHQPSQAEINAIIQMFACHGITLNAVIDDAVPHINVIPDSAGASNFFTWSGTNSFRWYKNQFFNNTGGGWHYCLFGHQYDPEDSTVASTCSSGLGETGGDDFIVTLGCADSNIGTAFDRAATFAHELGHNLGLGHSAGDETVDGAFSPNYASIMSYQYQLEGVRSQMLCLDLVDSTSAKLLKEIDYSWGRFPTVDETALSESRGVGVRSIDWNCNGNVGGIVAQDLNGQTWCSMTGAKTEISDKNDWASLVDNTFTELPPSRYEPCVTADKAERYKMLSPATCSGAGVQPALTTEPCITPLMIWVDASYSGPSFGTGDFPFNSFRGAYDASSQGSVILLQPTGAYNTGGVTTLSKPMTIAGPGVVTITP